MTEKKKGKRKQKKCGCNYEFIKQMSYKIIKSNVKRKINENQRIKEL